MSATEDQLRDALRGFAALVEDTGPALVPARRRRAPWLVPAAVALTVVLVVIAGVAVSSSLRAGTHDGLTGGAPSRFVVAVAGEHEGPAWVRNARTGKVIATVSPPAPMRSFTAVSATRDDRVFFVAAARTREGAAIYRLNLRENGTVQSLDRLAERAAHYEQLAATPDGSRVAYAVPKVMPREKGEPAPTGPVQPGEGPVPLVTSNLRIDVMDVGNGRAQRYESPEEGDAINLSWSGDGRWLAFGGSISGGLKSGVWMFEPKGGGDPLRIGRRVTANEGDSLGNHVSPVLGADGSTLYVVAHQGDFSRLLEVDTTRRRPARTLFQVKYTPGPNPQRYVAFYQYARDPRSGRLVVVVPAARGATARLVDDRTGKTTTAYPFAPWEERTALAW